MTAEEAWSKFKAYMAHGQVAVGERYVPVALILAQVEGQADGELRVNLEKDAIVLWPADFPEAERGRVLADIAAGYAREGVLRSKRNVNNPPEQPGEVQG